jgi:hypothetical protein
MEYGSPVYSSWRGAKVYVIQSPVGDAGQENLAIRVACLNSISFNFVGQ